LHKYGLLGWKIKVSSDSTIKVHPCSCSNYNADFDGDCCLANVDLKVEAKVLLGEIPINSSIPMERVLDLELEAN